MTLTDEEIKIAIGVGIREGRAGVVAHIADPEGIGGGLGVGGNVGVTAGAASGGCGVNQQSLIGT